VGLQLVSHLFLTAMPTVGTLVNCWRQCHSQRGNLNKLGLFTWCLITWAIGAVTVRGNGPIGSGEAACSRPALATLPLLLYTPAPAPLHLVFRGLFSVRSERSNRPIKDGESIKASGVACYLILISESPHSTQNIAELLALKHTLPIRNCKLFLFLLAVYSNSAVCTVAERSEQVKAHMTT
jgi:hypothetical protein